MHDYYDNSLRSDFRFRFGIIPVFDVWSVLYLRIARATDNY